MESEEDSVVSEDMSSKNIVYSMIFDYAFHEAWQEFSDEFTVDSETNREFISALVQKVGRYCENYETMMKSHLLHFMVLLCDSKTSLLENGDSQTYLERALGCLGEIDREELGNLPKMIRLQAVVACCRDGDWQLAREVYQRLWPNGHSGSNSEKKILQAILHGRNGTELLQKCMTYDKFLQHTQEALQTVVDTFSVPLLHSAGVRLAQHASSSQSSCDNKEGEDDEFDTADELTGGMGSQESRTGDAPADENDNNNNEVEMLQSIELEPRRTRSTAAKSDGNQQVDHPDEEDDNIEFSELEVPRRELRSRTIPGYVKTQMILSNSKKTTEAGKSDDPAEEESMEMGDYGQDESLVMDLAAVADNSDRGEGSAEGSERNSGKGSREEESSVQEAGTEETVVRGERRLRQTKARKVSDSSSGQAEDIDDGGAAEEKDTEAVNSGRSPQAPGTGPEGKTNQARLKQSTLDWGRTSRREKGNDRNDGRVSDDVGGQPEAEGDEEEDGDDGGLSEPVEGRADVSDLNGGAALELTIPGALLRNAFTKMGYGSRFRDSVSRELATLRKSLIEIKAKRRRSSNPPPEDGSEDVPSATSTPNEKTKGTPIKKTPIKVTPTKMTPTKMTPTKITPTKDVFVIPNSPLQGEAGPSGLNSSHLPGNFYRKKNRLRELERACDEEDGERVTFSDEDDSSGGDSDVESIISRAALKSPKLRRDLQPSRKPLKRPWTTDEVRMLIKGVKKFGVGRWAEMISYYDFENRTNVNLKDKWRQLQRKFMTSSPSKMSL